MIQGKSLLWFQHNSKGKVSYKSYLNCEAGIYNLCHMTPMKLKLHITAGIQVNTMFSERTD